MKVAIVHDVFIEIGGAERVLLALLTLYPSADIYIPLLTNENLNVLKEKTTGKIVTSFFNSIPFVHSASILLKPFLYLYWEQLDLHKYDLVISSSHSFSSKSVITGPKTRHISYIHTPPRYLYSEYNETQIIKHPFFKILLSPLVSWLRKMDYKGAQRPDILIANSKTVQARIKKYYHRDSIVIYPPVAIPQKISKRNPQYFVCVSRLARQKGINLAIEACNRLHERLVIVGEGSQEQYLRSIAGSTIEFLGNVPDSQMANVWSGAKALLYPSIEEDFGIVPVEAMAHGVPVIGHNSGGTAETVIHGKTGILFDEWNSRDIVYAISAFYKKSFKAYDLTTKANKFSQQKFISSIRAVAP